MAEASRIAALDQVLQLVVMLNDDMRQRLARDGLTPSRTHLLWVLQQRGPTTHRELAEALNVSKRTITGLVDGLVATGFVARAPHPTDRRASLVEFTEQGARIADALQRDQRELSRLLFGDMSAERFAHFTAALDEVLAKLAAAGVTLNPLEDR